MVKVGASTPINKKLSLKKMNSNDPNLPNSGSSEVREFEGGKLKKVTIFEDEGNTLITIDNIEDVMF